MSICKLFGKGCQTLCKPFRGRMFCIEYVILFLFCLTMSYVYLYRIRLKYLPSLDLANNFANCSGCDWWALGHFIYYIILGFLFPHLLFELTIIGILWEFLETFMQIKNFGFLQAIKAINEKDWNSWFGRVSDVAFNTVGLVVGWKLRQYFD